jgi:hypothetical protein
VTIAAQNTNAAKVIIGKSAGGKEGKERQGGQTVSGPETVSQVVGGIVGNGDHRWVDELWMSR